MSSQRSKSSGSSSKSKSKSGNSHSDTISMTSHQETEKYINNDKRNGPYGLAWTEIEGRATWIMEQHMGRYDKKINECEKRERILD